MGDRSDRIGGAAPDRRHRFHIALLLFPGMLLHDFTHLHMRVL